MISTLKCLDILKKLISFPTISQDSNIELIHWIDTYLREFGAETRITATEDGRKANLFATFAAFDGNKKEGGIIFSGHTDVVPVEGQDWATDPFDLHIGNGKAYGRGTCDMKGFIATVLACVEQISSSKLKVPIHFAFSYDEEIGCVGVNYLISDLLKAGFYPKSCIVGEPSMMEVVGGHKGKKAFKVQVVGHEAHSSLTPLGVNAIEYAARLIEFIRRRAEVLKNTKESQDSFFNPAYNTFSTGVISGGTALNIVPNYCEFQFEYRYIPGAEHLGELDSIFRYAKEELVPQMKKIHEQSNIIFTNLVDFPGFKVSDDAEIITSLKAITGANRISSVPYGAEAGLFAENGIQSLICGPGSIEQAHKANEFISLDQLERGEKFVKKVIAYNTI